MRTARCLGGPLHGQVVSIQGEDVRAPLYRHYRAPHFSRRITPYTDHTYDTETYRLKLIDIPMGRRGAECEWSYREWVLIPEWMSDGSAGAAIKQLGYLFERR